MKVYVQFTASFIAAVEVPDDATLRQIGEEVANIDIPESESVRYVEDTFEPDCEENGDPLLYDDEGWPKTLQDFKDEADEQNRRDMKRCSD